MRTTIRRRLIDAVEEVQVAGPGPGDIDYAASRVFEPHGATDATVKPFIVFGEADRDPSEAPSPMATAFEAHPYVDRETFRLLDTMHEEIRAAFDWQVFSHDDKPLLAELLPGAEDVLDGRWNGFTKPVRFQVFDLSMFVTETFEPDPIAGLRAWADETWPAQGDPAVPQIQTDITEWLPSDAAPGVMFRFVGIPTLLEQWPNATWFSARIAAHVIAPDRHVRLQWTRRLTESLALARHVALGDGSYFYLESIAADSSAHAVRDGQITLTGRYGVLIPLPEEELLLNPNVS